MAVVIVLNSEVLFIIWVFWLTSVGVLVSNRFEPRVEVGRCSSIKDPWSHITCAYKVGPNLDRRSTLQE